MPLLTSFVAGCAAGFGPRPCSASPDAAEILVVGDSILAFNAGGCASIPDVLSAELDRPVRNAAASGARMSAPWGYPWGDIRNQYDDADYDWVVVEGGINDLTGECDCDACEDVLDALVSADGSEGEVPALIDQAVDDGAQVALMAYYDLPDTARMGFDACGPWIDALRDRFRAAAERRPEVRLADPAEAMNPVDDPEGYRKDGVHPTVEGSALVGAWLADLLR